MRLMAARFTVCVLLYGDYPQLATRCLGSICRLWPAGDCELRVALNSVSPQTREAIAPYMSYMDICWDSASNRRKYPMMRRMFFEEPVTTPYVMWFDDDSYLDADAAWWDRVAAQMDQADMIGSIYRIGWRGRQREFVCQQPWYAGRDVESRSQIVFATGGWWTIRTEILRRFDYPWTSLDHCGGDVMLGELCYQQQLRLRMFRDGVRINANDAGRESAAPRRGVHQPPLGTTY